MENIDMMSKKKLTDITSSETNLPRFSYIIKKIYDEGYVGEKKIVHICEKSGIKHKKVIRRHLHILKILDLIIKRGNIFYVSSYGKIIGNFFKNINSLTQCEKSIYFQLFFKNIFDQLFYLIKIIKLNEKKYLRYNESFNNNVIEYFSLEPIQRIWNKKTLEESINFYLNTGLLKRGIENKFETMIKWLEHLDIIYKKNNIKLTHIGTKIYNEFLNKQITENNIDKASLYILKDYIRKTDIINDYNKIKTYYLNTIPLFTSQEGLGDLIAINGFVFIKLALDYSIYLDEKSTKEILSKFQQENIIRSFILNRKGKLAFIQTK